MAVPAWKVLAAATGIVAVVGVVLALTDTPLFSVTGVGILVFAAVFTVLFYGMTKRGYRVGREIGGPDED